MDFAAVADEGRRAAAGAGRHQRLRQGRHRRVPSAGRRLGLRPAGHASPPRTPSSASIWCWPSAFATARCPPASTPSRRTASSTSTPTPTTSAASSSRRSASTPTPASSSSESWPTPTRWAGRATPRLAGRIRAVEERGGEGTLPPLRPLRRRSDAVRPGPAEGDVSRRADVRGRDLCGTLGGRGVHGRASRAPISIRPTTRRWAGRSRRRWAPSASTPAGRSSTVTGDGCFLMTAMEISTAAREGLPVKFFVLDDQAYHYMQVLQETGVPPDDGDDPGAAGLRGPGEGLRRRVHGDRQRQRPGRRHPRGAGTAGAGADARRHRLRQAADPLAGRGAQAATSKELTTEQKVRFLARLGSRALELRSRND